MANTYSQIRLHIVFAVKGRECLIPKIHNDELQKYITGIVTNLKCKMLAINNVPDHAHMFIGMNPDLSVSELIAKIKSNSSKWLNDNKYIRGRFEWQRGYGVFSYSKSQTSSVINYITGQEEHHKKKTFREEYIEFLEKFEIDYKPDYLFEWIE